jgi:hypothetical protein
MIISNGQEIEETKQPERIREAGAGVVLENALPDAIYHDDAGLWRGGKETGPDFGDNETGGLEVDPKPGGFGFASRGNCKRSLEYGTGGFNPGEVDL